MPASPLRSWRARSAAVVVAAALAASLSPAAPATAEEAAPAPAPGVEPPADLVIDLTFPADPAGRYSDDYTQPRSSGRTHCGTDILGRKHSALYAAVGGVIEFMPTAKPSYGYMIALRGDDGRKYSYVHLNDDTPGTDDDAAGPEHAYAPGLVKGSKVARGQLLGFMGDSGNTKGTPHLHFEIHDARYETAACQTGGINRINPYASLEAARAEGDHGTSPATAPAAGAGTTPTTRTTPTTTPTTPTTAPVVGGTARTIQRACTTGVVGAAFTDVGPTHAAGVRCISGWQVAAGTSPTTFSPTGPITRAQLATFVANLASAAGRPLPRSATDHFDDDDGSVHEGNINRVAAAGIMGSADRRFSPDLAVARGSMATVVAKSYRYRTGVALAAGLDSFTDVADNPNEGNIGAVASHGIAVGYADGTFRPLAGVTREQMATFFARLLDALVETGHATPPA